VCGPPLSWFTCPVTPPEQERFLTDNEIIEHVMCVPMRDRKHRWLTMIAGQCEFERVVGDTTAIACSGVHPSVILSAASLSTKCLYSPRSYASKLILPGSPKFSCCTKVIPASHPNSPPAVPSPSPHRPWASYHSFTECDPHGRAK
jgi:hypothetical protein